jgi:hypothetical protein
MPFILTESGTPIALESGVGDILTESLFAFGALYVIGNPRGAIAGPGAIENSSVFVDGSTQPALYFDFSNILTVGETITAVIKLAVSSQPGISGAIVGGYGVPLARVRVGVHSQPSGVLSCTVSTSFARIITLRTTYPPPLSTAQSRLASTALSS